MRTKQYNPSHLEVAIATAIKELSGEIEAKLNDFKIVSIENKIQEDNPMVKIKINDSDGDEHEVVLKIIQKPDQF